MKDAVGLRPSRPSVRLEREDLHLPSKTLKVSRVPLPLLCFEIRNGARNSVIQLIPLSLSTKISEILVKAYTSFVAIWNGDQQGILEIFESSISMFTKRLKINSESEAQSLLPWMITHFAKDVYKLYTNFPLERNMLASILLELKRN